MDNKLLTKETASELILLVQPLLRSNGSTCDLRLGQALMNDLYYNGFHHLYDKIVKEDDFYYEEDDELVLEKFYKICVEDNQ